jgi:hypothetical protein
MDDELFDFEKLIGWQKAIDFVDYKIRPYSSSRESLAKWALR